VFALGHPDRDATLPRLTAGRTVPAVTLAALAVALLGAGFTRVRARWLPGLWAAGLPLAALSLVLWRGWPSLSNPVVYPPQGRDMMLAALPGLLPLLAGTTWAVRRWPAAVVPLVGAPGALLAAVTLALLFACGGVAALLGSPRPPLDPAFTGPASFLLAVSAATFPGLALAALAGLAASRWWPVPAAAAPLIAGPPPSVG
jgi:hypothetical protein